MTAAQTPTATGGHVWIPSAQKNHPSHMGPNFIFIAGLCTMILTAVLIPVILFITPGYNNADLVLIQQKCSQAVNSAGTNIFDEGGGKIYTGLKVANLKNKQVVYESSISHKIFTLKDHDTGKTLCSVPLGEKT